MNNNYAETLSRMIQAETVSVKGIIGGEKFKAFLALLRKEFPNVFSACEEEIFDDTLLLCWKGSNSSKQPVMLMSHYDVVEATGKWTHPPFSGEIADGKIWGRGTLDTKGNLWAILQAAEELIKDGFVPERDIYIESACNEESGGEGADAVTKEFMRRKIRFHLVLDEGGMIMYDPIGGADGTFAMVGIGEKGCADLKFIARSSGGHASTPAKDTPLVRLGKFMAAVEKSNIFEVKLSDTIKEMIRRFSPYMKSAFRPVTSNPDVFAPVLAKVLPQMSASAGAMLKTTLAFTMAHGSEGLNVLPQEAWVIGNMRYSHHQGQRASIEAVRKLAAKFDIETEVIDPGFESTLSPYDSDAFALVEKAVDTVFPGVHTVPYIMTGASDSRFYTRVCDNCFRFAPFKIDNTQLSSIHGIDENLNVDTLAQAVEFFKYVIKEA